MGRIANRSTGHTVSLRLLNELFHHTVTGHHAHTVMCIHDQCRRCLFDDLQIGHRQQCAVLDTVDIDRFKAVAAVAFDTASVRFEQDVRTDRRFIARHAVCGKHISHKCIHLFP